VALSLQEYSLAVAPPISHVYTDLAIVVPSNRDLARLLLG